MENFADFCRNLTRDYNRKRMMFDGVDRRKADIKWNYDKFSLSEKTLWESQAKEAIDKNDNEGIVSDAVSLLLHLDGWPERLLDLLKKNPDKSKNHWNEIIVSGLVELKFNGLSKETLLVERVLKYFRTDLFRLDFLLHYAHLNQQYALDRICDLIVNQGYGSPKALEYSGEKIYSMLHAVDKSLPTQLITCAKKGGVDISSLLM